MNENSHIPFHPVLQGKIAEGVISAKAHGQGATSQSPPACLPKPSKPEKVMECMRALSLQLVLLQLGPGQVTHVCHGEGVLEIHQSIACTNLLKPAD